MYINGLSCPASVVRERDLFIVKQYSENFYQGTFMRSCMLPGYEGRKVSKRNSAGNTQKCASSLSRTRRRIFELVQCNEWEYFATLTLSPQNGDRYDLREFKRSLSKWLNNLNSKYRCHIKYLLVSEPHKNGAWHFHGFFMGIPDFMLKRFSIHDKLPYDVLKLIRDGKKVYNWPVYASKFGHVTLEKIRNHDASARYISKYITKEVLASCVELNSKLYICSLGLKRSQVLYRGKLRKAFEPDFCNEYVATKSFTSLLEATEYIADDNFSLASEDVSFFSVLRSYFSLHPERDDLRGLFEAFA